VRDIQYHSVYSEWVHDTSAWGGLQWNIFFICISLILGSIMQWVFGASVPYTVGILIMYIIFGAVAETQTKGLDCPWHAWVYSEVNSHGGHYVAELTQDGWNKFICAGCDPAAFCIMGEAGTDFAGRRSCGDGSLDPPDCRWTFDELNSEFKVSSMLAESVKNMYATTLSADQLWRNECNLFRAMLGLADIDPHVLLVVFLPALLFESACFGVDFGIFKKQAVQICLLAFPAMICSSIITGLLIMATIPQWNLWVCWLIGIILSATDPVAVVALLKELGASKALGTIIEGESLLNDGSAIVLFTWVRNVIGYTSSVEPPPWMMSEVGDGLEFVRYGGNIGAEFGRVVAQMLVFAGIFGYAFGMVTVWMCRLNYEAQLIEGPLVIAMSYMCFWLGELICGTSAVIAVVIMGLYVNKHKSGISPEVFHFLHLFYGMSAHILNTVIFAIAGAKLGILLADGSQLELFQDYWWQIMIVIYLIILFARGFSIMLFYPLLSRFGTGCTWQEAVVMWWGGLRGSVGLALALAIQHTMYDANMWGCGKHVVHSDISTQSSVSLNCRDQPSMVVFMTVICVFFTVVINGVTMAPLMKLLKMTDLTPARKMMVNGSFAKIRAATNSKKNSLRKEETFYKHIDWNYVDRDGLNIDVFYSTIEKEEVPKAAWLSVLQIERASYIEAFHHGTLSPDGFAALEAFMATISADASKIPANKPDGHKWEKQTERPGGESAPQPIDKPNLAQALAAKNHRIGMLWADLGMVGKRKQLKSPKLEYMLACKSEGIHSVEDLWLTADELDDCNLKALRADDCFVVVDVMLGLQWVELSPKDVQRDANGHPLTELANDELSAALDEQLAKAKARNAARASRNSSTRKTPLDMLYQPVVRFTREAFDRFGIMELTHDTKVKLRSGAYMKPVDFEEFNTRRLKPLEPEFTLTAEEFKRYGLDEKELQAGDYVGADGVFFKPSDRLSHVYDCQFDVLVKQLKKPRGRMTLDQRIHAYNIAKAYISGQIEVRHAMKLFKMSLANQSEADTERETAHKLAISAMDKVEREHRDNIEKMADLLASVDEYGRDNALSYRRFKAYKNRYASTMVLLAQSHQIEHLQGEGLIDDLDAAPLQETIRKKIEHIQRAPVRYWVRQRIRILRDLFTGTRNNNRAAEHLPDEEPEDKPFSVGSFCQFFKDIIQPKQSSTLFVNVEGSKSQMASIEGSKSKQPDKMAAAVSASSASASAADGV